VLAIATVPAPHSHPSFVHGLSGRFSQTQPVPTQLEHSATATFGHKPDC
jgi:hypothetical protein